jgi:hypothetical protein
MITINNYWITEAVSNLRPGVYFSVVGDSYDGIVWTNQSQTKPTEEEVNAEIAILQNQQPLDACKKQASQLLYETDWTTIPDVADSTNSPYLKNQAEFIAWRNEIRKFAVNPIANPVFPSKPEAVWG